MKEFDEKVEQCKTSMKLCPWSKEQGVAGYAKEIKLEADELIEAIEANNIEEICDELGDIFNDCIHVAVAANIPIEKVLRGSVDKINRRKPFLAEGRQVEMDEAKRTWKKVKENEKT